MLCINNEDPIKMLRQFSQHFEAPMEEGPESAQINFNNALGKGYFCGCEIYTGLFVLIINISIRHNLKFEQTLSSDGPFYFGYNVQGYPLHKLEHERDFSRICPNQYFILSGQNGTKAYFEIPKEVDHKSCYLIVGNDIIEQNLVFGKALKTLTYLVNQKHENLNNV